MNMLKIEVFALLVLFIAKGSSLKCYTYTCGSHNGLSCSSSFVIDREEVMCGIAGKGYQSVCSYVAIDNIKNGGYSVETACDLVPIGRLQDVELKRCFDKDTEGKVVYCNICNTDLCNKPPRN